jgi:glycosyltransferase involved in cell wall biosynthesis
MKKVKILHKISASMGGIERYVFNNLEFINRDRFQFDILTRNMEIKNSEECKKYGFEIKYFSNTYSNNKELFIKEISDIFDSGYDVIHLHTTQWTGFLLEEIAMEKKIPKVIVHSHSTGELIPMNSTSSTDTHEKYKNLHEYYKAKFNERLATDFCACSWSAADWLFGPQIQRDKIQLMKNAINVDKYIFNQKIRKEVREKLGVENCFVLGHVGRMSKEKNHEFLIDTFNEVYKRNNKARLLLIGEGNTEVNIKDKVNEYGLQDVVILLGWRNDVERIMQAMDLFLLPSLFEGLGIVLIEAQAAGLKCICSDRVPKEAAITNNVEFIPLDIDKWADKVFKNSNDYDRENMYECITNAGYNIKYSVKELEKLYEL